MPPPRKGGTTRYPARPTISTTNTRPTDQTHVHPAFRTNQPEPAPASPITPWPTTTHFQHPISPQISPRSRTRMPTAYDSTPTTGYTRPSFGTSNTSRSSGPTTVGSVSMRSDVMDFALDGRLYQLGNMHDRQIMDMRYAAAMTVRPVRPAAVISVIKFLKPIIKTTQQGSVRATNLEGLESINTSLLSLMVSHNAPPTLKNKWMSANDRALRTDTAIHNARLQLSNIVHSVGLHSLFGPMIGAEREQTDLMILLMLYTRRPPVSNTSSTDIEREKTKYARLAGRIGKVKEKIPTSQFLHEWDYRLKLIAYAETLYWKYNCQPLPGLIRPETAVLPHHALSLLITQLALWPKSDSMLIRTKLSQPDLPNGMFLHLDRHQIKLDFDENFKLQMGKIRQAWIGHQNPLTDYQQRSRMTSIMDFGSTCETEALDRWSVKPRSWNPARPGMNSDKPLPNPNDPLSRRKVSDASDYRTVASDRRSTVISPSSPAHKYLPDLDQRQQRIRDKVSGKPTNWDPPVVTRVYREITLASPSSPVPGPIVQPLQSRAPSRIQPSQPSTSNTAQMYQQQQRPRQPTQAPPPKQRQQQAPPPKQKQKQTQHRFLGLFGTKSTPTPSSSQAGRRAKFPPISAPMPIPHPVSYNTRPPPRTDAFTAFVPQDKNSIKLMSETERRRVAALAKARTREGKSSSKSGSKGPSLLSKLWR